MKALVVLGLLCLPLVTFAKGSNFDIRRLQEGDVLVGKLRGENGADLGQRCEVHVKGAEADRITIVATLAKTSYEPLQIHRTFDAAGIRYQWKGALGPAYPSQVGECHNQQVATLQRSAFGSRVDLKYSQFEWCEHAYNEDVYATCAELQKR